VPRPKMSPAARKEAARWGRIKRKYGITKEQWMAIYDDQDGRCYICQRDEKQLKRSKSKYLCVDHKHSDGSIRGLLCGFCNNKILPALKESPEMAMRIVKYLSENKDYGIAPPNINKSKNKKKALVDVAGD